MSFAQPVPASDVKIADYVGHLLLIYPRSIRTGIVTTNGISDAIVADVVILTHPEGPKAEPNVLVFQKVLQATLKGSIGADPVLSRLARGVAKPGQSAPYVLNEFDQNDAQYATGYLNSVGNNPFPSFQAAASAPAPQAAPVPVPVAAAPVAPVAAPIPVAAPMAPIPQAVPIAAPMPVAAPFPQAPGVPQAPPQWAAPAVAQAAPQAAPVANQAEAAAALQALGMTQPPPAPAIH